jgi:putative ABC transport system substrate-binding protein
MSGTGAGNLPSGARRPGARQPRSGVEGACHRRAFLVGAARAGLALSTLAILPGCGSSPGPSAPRIVGFLAFGPAPAEAATNFDVFRDGLRELGHVEGQDVVVERRLGQLTEGGFTEPVADLMRLRPRVIVAAAGLEAIRAARAATTAIPIVMVVDDGDPVENGFIASLSRPGGNITGLTRFFPEINGKRLELLRDAIPGITRVAILWSPSAADRPRDESIMRQAADRLQMTPLFLDVQAPADLPGALQAAEAERVDAIIGLPSPILFRQRNEIVAFAANQQLPTSFPSRAYVDAGGLMSYGPSLPDLHRRAATYVDKLLRGTPAPELPVERPVRFDLVLNLKTAQAIGVTPGRSFLLNVTDVIQ